METNQTVRMELGDLADPAKYTDPVNVTGLDSEKLIQQLRTMMIIRRVEEKLADGVLAKKIICPCHLGIGQEATAVGVSSQLRKTDRIFGTHRSHTHYLSLGGTVESLFAETLGKETGCSKGMGGSMHLFNDDIGFKGSVPIVAATVPMGVGAALAAKMDGGDNLDVGVSYFGDGTTEEGSVHESLNFAAVFKLPMLFVVENNLFSSHLHIKLRQPHDSVARFAAVHGMNHEVVDGNDVRAVAEATGRLIEKARKGEGPGFLESVTYRWRGHVGPSEDIDVGLKRSGDLALWKERDPVRRLKEGLIQAGHFSEEKFEKLQADVNDHIEGAWMRAEEAPFPKKEALLKHVWAPKKKLNPKNITQGSFEKMNFGQALCAGFDHLLANHKEVFTIGQGLWSPWYVGNSMKDLDSKFGKERVIDTPVSEAATTAAAIGASLCGYKPVVIHPRMDFMILAADAMVNQAAKWSHMLGGQAHPGVTVRGIINRGGQQGAQHSQALHSWYAHIPGLRVVMPTTVQDARDLLVASVLCEDPVLFIDDRWLYDQEEELKETQELDLTEVKPVVQREGKDITLVAAGFSTLLARQAAEKLADEGVSAEVVDLRVVNPIDYSVIVESVKKTGRILAIDGGWENCGLAGEIIAGVCERVDFSKIKAQPARMALTASPAPTSGPLEEAYYLKPEQIIEKVKSLVK